MDVHIFLNVERLPEYSGTLFRKFKRCPLKIFLPMQCSDSPVTPGDSQGIIKYHSNQCVRCWKQWRTDELDDVLCPSGAYEKVFW